MVVLVAIFGEKDSHAVYYLHQQGITRLDVVNFIAHGIKKSDPPEPAKSNENPGNEGEKEEGGEAKGSPLDQYTQNLNQLARDGKIDPLIGREHEVRPVLLRQRHRPRERLGVLWVRRLHRGKASVALQLLRHGEAGQLAQGREDIDGIDRRIRFSNVWKTGGWTRCW